MLTKNYIFEPKLVSTDSQDINFIREGSLDEYLPNIAWKHDQINSFNLLCFKTDEMGSN